MRSAKIARDYVLKYRDIHGGETISVDEHGKAIAGQWAVVNGGDVSTIVVGYHSDATAGQLSVLVGGHSATLKAGERSTLIWLVWDDHRSRVHVEYVGENGIKPNTQYIGYFKNDGEFVVEEVL